MQFSNFAVCLGQGMAIPGNTLTQEAAIALAELRCPNRPFCIVSQWLVLDVSMTPAQQQAVFSVGLHPVALYAGHVLLDSCGRFQPGDWLRSTLSVWYEESGLFCTPNTLYVLTGPGRRHAISLDDFLTLI